MKKWLLAVGVVAVVGLLNACKHEVVNPGTGPGGGTGGGGGTDSTIGSTCNQTIYFLPAAWALVLYD